MEKKILNFILVFLIALVMMNIASAAANFVVTSFACSPSEIVVNDVFSCTAQIRNSGDVAGSVSTATLFPDANNWLESSSYAQASGTSVSPGETTDITFTGLKAIKSGNNGFSKITLDSVTDTWVADNNVKVNSINVVVTVSDSVSSAAKGVSFTSSSEVTAGGNIDVTLTITIDSGGCSIGSQSSQKTISDMQDGNKQSRSWTITQGTSGDCKYTISASATGDAGVASKTDSTSSSVTCTNCPSGGGSSSSTSGGGGGGGTTTTVAEELTASIMQDIGKDESIKFKFGGVDHSVTIVELTETNATITIESEKQTITLTVGEEKLIDLDKDGRNEISVRLKSINIITKKALIIVNPLYIAATSGKGGAEDKAGAEGAENGLGQEQAGAGKKSQTSTLWILLIIIIVLIVIIAVYLAFSKYKTRKKLRGY